MIGAKSLATIEMAKCAAINLCIEFGDGPMTGLIESVESICIKEGEYCFTSRQCC